jgi:hypothetical protein
MGDTGKTSTSASVIRKAYHLCWLLISVLLGIYAAASISPEKIELPNIDIPLYGSFKPTCDDRGYCNAGLNSRDFTVTPAVDAQINNFNNFFPLSIFARFNIEIYSQLDTNINVKVTYPEFMDKVNKIEILCSGDEVARFTSKSKLQKQIEGVSKFSIDSRLKEYFDCRQTTIKFAYEPSDKIEVGPNQYVIFASDGDTASVRIENITVITHANSLTRLLAAAIVFFLTLGAGSLLFLFIKSGFDTGGMQELKNPKL